MKQFNVCLKSMQGIIIAIVVFGGLMALFNTSLLAPLLGGIIDQVFWPSEKISEGTALFRHWIVSLLGAMMVAWGMALWGISRHAFAERKIWAWNTIMISTLGWFVIDESFSLSCRVWVNAIGNLPLFFALTGVLLVSRKYMVAEE